MDLTDLKPSEIAHEIHSPADETKLIGIRVGLVSIDDDRMKKLKRFIANESLKLQQRGKTVSAEKLEENENKLMFAAMTGWDWYGDITYKGEKPTFNETNVNKVFNEFNWFREQISKKVGETESFFPT